MPKSSIIVLGSSSGVPQAGRASSGYLLKTGDSATLFDCGGGVTMSFLQTGIDPLEIDRIFISHTHPDHVSDLPLMIQLIYLKGRTKPLEIFLPEEFVEIFKKYLNAVYLLVEKIPFELKIAGYGDGFKYEGNLKIKAIGNSHLKRYAELVEEHNLPNKMMCHSFEIEFGDKSLFYSADIGEYAEIKTYLYNRDLAIVEAAHIDLEQFIADAPEFSTKTLVISHLGSVEDVAQIKELIQKAGLENVVIAEDGLEFEL